MLVTEGSNTKDETFKFDLDDQKIDYENPKTRL